MKAVANRNVILRPAKEGDFEDILRLNEESVHFLSPLTLARLEKLNSWAELNMVALCEGELVAFIFSFKEGSDYESVNYRWFHDIYPNFLYIDRVVVDKRSQRMGFGKLLYEEIFRHARNIGSSLLAAEIDVKPPNPVSLNFHKQFGFQEVGRQEVGGGKIVSMQVVKI